MFVNRFQDYSYNKTEYPLVPLEVKINLKLYFKIQAPAQEIKKPAQNINYRRQMCRSINAGKVCEYGNKCRFAHKLSELNILNCKWGNKCQNVYHTCMNIHPYENLEKYYIRTGLVKHKMPTRILRRGEKM